MLANQPKYANIAIKHIDSLSFWRKYELKMNQNFGFTKL